MTPTWAVFYAELPKGSSIHAYGSHWPVKFVACEVILKKKLMKIIKGSLKGRPTELKPFINKGMYSPDATFISERQMNQTERMKCHVLKLMNYPYDTSIYSEKEFNNYNYGDKLLAVNLHAFLLSARGSPFFEFEMKEQKPDTKGPVTE